MPKKLFRQPKLFLILLHLLLIPTLFNNHICAQNIVDKTVATISDGTSKPQLITYSDLLWQLALEPDAPLSPPTSGDLNRALESLIEFRLFALEAERLPSAAPSEDEIKEEINDILRGFNNNTSTLERRLRIVGFDSIQDDNFQTMMRRRAEIKKYVNFRFRSFVIITPDEERKYYRDTFTPDFRRRNPGLLLPQFEEVRAKINEILTEQKIEEDITKFIDEAKSRAEIVILFEV
jgi:hypothetical protein